MIGWGNPYTAQSGLSPWGGNEMTGMAPPATAFGGGGMGGFGFGGHGTTNNYYGWGGQNQTGYAPTFGTDPSMAGGFGGGFNSAAGQTAMNWANQAAALKKPLDMDRLNRYLGAVEIQRAGQANDQLAFNKMVGYANTNNRSLIPDPQGGLRVGGMNPAGSAYATKVPRDFDYTQLNPLPIGWKPK